MKTIRKARSPRAALLRTTMAGLAAVQPGRAGAETRQRRQAAGHRHRRRAARRAHRDAHDLPVDGQGKDSYEVANGSVATYWYGHAFELNGTRYFTGFTWDTRERYGKPGEDDAGPDTQVNLAEATTR